MLQNAGMICHWKFELLLHFHGDLKLNCFRSLFPSLGFLSTVHWSFPWRWPYFYVLQILIYVLQFGWRALESASLEIKHMDTWFVYVYI